MPGYLLPADESALFHEEEFEKSILFCRKANRFSVARNCMISSVQSQIRRLKHCGSKFFSAPQERTDSRKQFFKLERLAQIIIRSAVESHYPVVNVVARGQHQHGSATAARAQFAADLKSVLLGKHDIQDDQVVIVYGGVENGLFAIRRHVDGITVLAQTLCDKSSNAGFIFH